MKMYSLTITWESIQAFFQDWGGVSFGVLISALIAAVLAYVVKKLLPNLANQVLIYVSKVIGKMFGVSDATVSNTITELPIVKQLESQHAEWVVSMELKLVELKNKLISPKLTELEIIAYQAQFDQIMETLGNKVSAATQKALDNLDALATKRLSL